MRAYQPLQVMHQFHLLRILVIIILQYPIQCRSFLMNHHSTCSACSSGSSVRASLSMRTTKQRSLQTSNDHGGEQESQADKLLREFFNSSTTSNHFTVAEEVITSFLNDNQNRNSQPILIKCGDIDMDESLNDEKHHHPLLNENWSQLFDPLFSKSELKGLDCNSSLTEITKQPHQTKTKVQSFKITVAYRGTEYCGWQIQPKNTVPSVQQTLIDLLDPILGNSLGHKSEKPIDIRVCGRTDAGVSAIAQVCRVRTRRSSDEVTAIDIEKRINDTSQSVEVVSGRNLCCTSVERVSDKFHPTFCAKNRAYAYLIDSTALNELMSFIPSAQSITIGDLVFTMNKMAKQAEGLELDYVGLSYGKVKTTTTLCTLSRAQVSLVKLNDDIQCRSGLNEAVCFEFVGDRFLRRMIRIMLSTLLSLAIQCVMKGYEKSHYEYDDLFLSLVRSCDRKRSSRPAPSNGLIFVGATFVD